MWQKMEIIGSNDIHLEGQDGRALWVNIDTKPFVNKGPSWHGTEICTVEQALETNIQGERGTVVISVHFLEHAPGDDSFAEEVTIVPYEKWIKREIEAA